MRQLIIARKDLNMSPGKLAAQVAHAAMAFMSQPFRDCEPSLSEDLPNCYLIKHYIDKDIYEQWFCGTFTKTICEAKNFNQLMKAKTLAEELGMQEGREFFLIWDACFTELTPETIDDKGVGRTLTCIGFQPLPDETAWKISKKFQLYR